MDPDPTMNQPSTLPTTARRVVFPQIKQAEWTGLALPDELRPDQLLVRTARTLVSAGTEIAIYSGTGRLLTQRQIPGRRPGFVSGATWEDATHVLFTVHQAGHWSIARMGVDGRLAYAVPPVAARWDHGPFQLEVTP